jgi:L-threonylcarbamoyladenylate synthase
VQEDFGKNFPVIEAGETNIGLESTVLDITSVPYRIYRPGAVSAEEIARITGKKVIHASQQSTETSTRSPGTKYSHYAPDALVQWLASEVDPDDQKTLYLLHSGSNHPSREYIIEYDGDYRRMAHELYDRFRQADHQGLNKILIEPFSDIQLKKALVQALQNRISKAVG